MGIKISMCTPNNNTITTTTILILDFVLPTWPMLSSVSSEVHSCLRAVLVVLAGVFIDHSLFCGSKDLIVVLGKENQTPYCAFSGIYCYYGLYNYGGTQIDAVAAGPTLYGFSGAYIQCHRSIQYYFRCPHERCVVIVKITLLIKPDMTL